MAKRIGSGRVLRTTQTKAYFPVSTRARFLYYGATVGAAIFAICFRFRVLHFVFSLVCFVYFNQHEYILNPRALIIKNYVSFIDDTLRGVWPAAPANRRRFSLGLRFLLRLFIAGTIAISYCCSFLLSNILTRFLVQLQFPNYFLQPFYGYGLAPFKFREYLIAFFAMVGNYQNLCCVTVAVRASHGFMGISILHWARRPA
jgi:hypothetical protein